MHHETVSDSRDTPRPPIDADHSAESELLVEIAVLQSQPDRAVIDCVRQREHRAPVPHVHVVIVVFVGWWWHLRHVSHAPPLFFRDDPRPSKGYRSRTSI